MNPHKRRLSGSFYTPPTCPSHQSLTFLEFFGVFRVGVFHQIYEKNRVFLCCDNCYYHKKGGAVLQGGGLSYATI